MRCETCEHRKARSVAGARDYYCEFSGAQVGPFVMGGNRVDVVTGRFLVTSDDPADACCPLALEGCLHRKGGQKLAQGVLWQIGTRGRVIDLLAHYRAPTRDLLMDLYLQPV